MQQIRSRMRRIERWMIAAAVTMMCAATAGAQTYTFNALYPFDGTSGASPKGTLVSDASGNLYGTTEKGGADNYGTVFELVNNGGTYTEQVLYSFTGSSDGEYPSAGLTIDASGNLYGAASGGTADVFELVNAGGGTYSFKVLYGFTSQSSGTGLEGNLTLDANGDIYGVTAGGGNNYGLVYELVNNGGVYSEKILYAFSGGSDGSIPDAGVTLDSKGNIYGTTVEGGANGWGAVYELVSNGGGGYNEETLYSFTDGSDGASPQAGVTLDSRGDIFGTNQGDGTNTFGAVFELVNNPAGVYTETTLHVFSNANSDGKAPESGVIMDANGDLFGTTEYGGGSANKGTVYELVYSSSSGSYSEQILYVFTGAADGYYPKAGILLDSSGDLFGSSQNGGSSSDGAIWELSTASAATTSLTLTSPVNPIFQGESATLVATITPNPAGASVAGTVTFSEGSTQLGTASVSNNTAVFTVPAALLGTGSDTITAQFTPTSGSVVGSSGSVLETVNPASDVADLNGANTFTGNQMVNGGVTATNFNGNGAGLTNVIAAGLNCAACVGNAQLGVDYAGSALQGGPAVNSLLLGGLPASSFATVDSNSFSGDQTVNGSLTSTGNLNALNGNFSGSLSSAGVGLAPLGTATSAGGYNSGAMDTTASVFNSTAGAAQNMEFGWQAEPAAGTNNTAGPAATLNLLYGVNGTPSETGLSVNANGTINFAAGQTFPGAVGSITSVTAGAGLAGGGTSGNVTLNVAPNACPAGSALSALPFTCAPVVTPGANVFTGNQTINGTVTASAFVGNGAGLTNINVATATTAATAANALALGGQPASYYAIAGSNTFTSAQTMPSVNVTGGMQTGTLAIGGGTPITEYLSTTLPVTLPAIHPGACTTFQTAQLAGFTPGSDDTIAMGIPSALQSGLTNSAPPGPAGPPPPPPPPGPPIFLVYQAWETSSSANTTITLQVCNPSTPYSGGATGVIRFDIFRH